jgi:serine/threonine-protein kinase
MQIGRYEILGRLGSGGMSHVYKARDAANNRVVALKVLPQSLAAKEIIVRRFQREAQMAAKLKHENIVRIYDFGEAGGTLFLAMELVEGANLLAQLEKQASGRFDIDFVRQVLIQATKALDHMHQCGVVHRDVKPSNFFITYRNNRPLIKLGDLGLARDEDEEARLTRDQTTLGTVDYIAPEQARNAASADVRSDMYSLGCTAYHLLTGKPPFSGTVIERLQHHLFTAPADIRVKREDVPQTMARVVRRLLSKDPKERYQTPLELLQELEPADKLARYVEQTRGSIPTATVADEVPVASVREPAPPRGAGKRRPRTTTARALLIGLIVGGVIGGLALVALAILMRRPHP